VFHLCSLPISASFDTPGGRWHNVVIPGGICCMLDSMLKAKIPDGMPIGLKQENGVIL
jgi:hypothetical protein